MFTMPTMPRFPCTKRFRSSTILIKAGKTRAVGLSNETPWGVMECMRLAETQGLPRMVAIQNAYNLVNRVFEIGLAEVARREDVGLLAYSPMAGGTLSGKYEGGARPTGARMTRYGQDYTRFDTERGRNATSAYVGLARRHGLDPAQMALAFIYDQPFVTATIIGATSVEQLASNIDAFRDDAHRTGPGRDRRHPPRQYPARAHECAAMLRLFVALELPADLRARPGRAEAAATARQVGGRREPSSQACGSSVK